MAPEIVDDAKLRDIIKLYNNDRIKIEAAILNLWNGEFIYNFIILNVFT